MIAYNCPLGRVACDGCNHLTTAGCILKRNNNSITANSITIEDTKRMWNERHNELMKLSKEDLVEIIIGPKPYYCY
jgi:hypothetical protein